MALYRAEPEYLDFNFAHQYSFVLGLPKEAILPVSCRAWAAGHLIVSTSPQSRNRHNGGYDLLSISYWKVLYTHFLFNPYKHSKTLS